MNKQQQTYALIALLVGAGGYFYATKFFLPLRRQIAEKRKELADKTAALNEAKAKEAELHRLKKESAEFEAKVYATYARVPAKETFHRLLADVAAVETSSDVKVPNLKPPEGNADRGGYMEVPFSAVVEATMGTLADYINRLHRLSRLVVFQDLQMTESPGGLAKSLRAEVSFSAFLSKGDEPKWSKGLKAPSVRTEPPEIAAVSGHRDPFVPFTVDEIALHTGPLKLSRLELMGILRVGRMAMGMLQDQSTGTNYVLKRDGGLYERTPKGDGRKVDEVTGTIRNGKVVLWQVDGGKRTQRVLMVKEGK